MRKRDANPSRSPVHAAAERRRTSYRIGTPTPELPPMCFRSVTM